MSITYNDLLEFASSLPDNKEVNNRNAASCAYYSALHKCREHYGSEFDITVKGGSHEQLIRYLNGSCDKNEKELAFQLMQARKIRTIADYELEIDFKKSDRENAILYAGKIIEQCK